MKQNQSVNIRQISNNRAEQVGYYRFLENENVTVGELERSLSVHCTEQVEGKHVLAISDSSEINLESHVGRLKEEKLGVVGNNEDVGFYIHPTLVLDAVSGFPLGLSAVQLWSREKDHADKKERNYQNLPIEDKESYKWIASAQKSQRCFREGGARMVTHIGDRESDIFEEFATVPQGNHHLLVRACQNRRLLGKSESLFTYLKKQPIEGTYTINLEADGRIDRKAREALLTIRCAKVNLQRPDKFKNKDYPPSVELYAVEVEEVNPPKGTEKIQWRLLTTHSLVCFEEALQVVKWYQWRWRIEQLFATLKQAGLDLESTQLESVKGIQKLTILALSVAVRTLQMVEGREQAELAASLTFSEEQQQCLSAIEPSLEGSTPKLRNPYGQGSLPWATWLIARLGGWSGYRSQRPPGMPTLIHGLRKFESIFWGWKLSQTR